MRLPIKKSKLAPPGTSAPVSAGLALPMWVPALLLALVTMALYWPAMRCEFIAFDDDLYVTANLHVQQGLTLEGIKWAFVNPVDANWHPLTMLSHMLDCQLFGLNPWEPHLVNVLLHTANTVLVFLLLRGLTGAVWRSWFVAAFFGWHPLHVESVAWVSERKDVLSTFFGLLALMFYIRYARSKIPGQKVNPGSYLLAFLVFALGLMSKPMLVTWPFVFLLLDCWPLQRFQKTGAKQLIMEKIPFFVLAGAASVVTYLVQKNSAAVIAIGHLPIGARCGNALISYCRYLEKLFWPTDLAVFYPHPGYWPSGDVMLAGVALMAISVLVWQMRHRWPFMLMGWLWFCGILVPVIGLVQVGSQAMADRYTYLPSLGIFIIVTWGMFEMARCQRYGVPILTGLGLVALTLCFGVTRQQLGYWHDSETLMRHALAVTKDNYLIHNNLGLTLFNKGQIEEAINQYQEAIQIDPGFVKAHTNLGNALGNKGRLDEAILQYQEALRLNPNDADADYNLGIVFDMKGQLDDAIRQYREDLRLKPDDANAYHNLGYDLDMKGQVDDAIQQFQEAVRVDPGDAYAHYTLGAALGSKGRLDEVILQYQEALRINPGFADASTNLAIALQTKNASSGR